MNRSRIASVLLACLLVTAGVAGPISSTATAWEMGTQGECDGLDYMVHLVSFQQVNGDSCDLRYGDNSEMETHTDHYQQGETLKSSNDGFLQAYENFGEDTRSLAFSKAKITIVNGLNDGNTSSVVKSEANQTVRDYYAKQQKEILNQFDRTYRSMEYSYETNQSFVGFGSSQGSGHIPGFASIEVQLVNGSTTWIRIPMSRANDYNTLYHPFPASAVTGNARNVTADNSIDSFSSNTYDGGQSYVYESPNQDLSPFAPMPWSRVNTAFSDMSSQSSQVTANVDAYVDGTYSEYQQGEINTTDIADPQTLASQAATDYDSSGYYSYAAMNLAGLGYSGNLNSSFHVTTANNSYNGTLFYTADDVDSFKAGQTYDVSELNGTAYMAAQTDSGGTVVALKEDFTVESITNTETGSSMNSTTVESYTYESTNTSKLQEEINRLSSLREEYETMNSGGGGTGGSSGDSRNLLLVLLAGAAGALLLAGRDGGGNGGR